MALGLLLDDDGYQFKEEKLELNTLVRKCPLLELSIAHFCFPSFPPVVSLVIWQVTGARAIGHSAI